MAAGNAKLEGLLICPQCHCAFEDLSPDKRPRLLPCPNAHTFCAKCVVTLQLACPLCRESFEEIKVKDSVGILQLVELIRENNWGPKVDSTCANCRTQRAVIYCGECAGGADLCQACSSTVHSLALFRTHAVVPIAAKKAPDPRCPTHGETLTVFCSPCQELLCIACKELSHKEHEVSLVAAVAESSRVSMGQSLLPLATLKKRMANELVRLTELHALERQSEAQAREDITAVCQQLIAAIQERQAELLSEVQAKATNIGVQRNRIGDSHTRVNAVIEEIRLASAHPGHGLLGAKKAIDTHSRNATMEAEKCLSQIVTFTGTYTSAHPKFLLSEIRKFGSVGSSSAPVFSVCTAIDLSLLLAWEIVSVVGTPIFELEQEEAKMGFVKVYSGPKASFTCENLKSGTTYTYQVRVRDERGFSPFSKPVIHIVPQIKTAYFTGSAILSGGQQAQLHMFYTSSIKKGQNNRGSSSGSCSRNNSSKDDEDEEAKSWLLCYRGTRDGFNATNFHQCCDNKNETMIIVRATSGAIFGGYSPLSWSGNGYAFDERTFLFSLHRTSEAGGDPVKLTNTGPDHGNKCSIHKNAAHGPTFGGGFDLYIGSDCNLNNNSHSDLLHSFSCEKPPGFYRSASAREYLAGSYKFRVSELEVFCK